MRFCLFFPTLALMSLGIAACQGGSSGSNGSQAATETNVEEKTVFRWNCDAGACDAGFLEGSDEEPLTCEKDEDCPDGNRCNSASKCAPGVTR